MKPKLIMLLSSLWIAIFDQGLCSKSSESKMDIELVNVFIEKNAIFITAPESALKQIPEPTLSLDNFLCKNLLKNPLEETNLHKVLYFFEEWLKQQGDFFEFCFNRLIKLFDPNMKPNEQGSQKDAFRVECFIRLAELALMWRLEKTLVALVHPVNVPHVPEMCNTIFAASHYFPLEKEQEFLDYVQALKIANCLVSYGQRREFVKKASLTIIKLVFTRKKSLFAILKNDFFLQSNQPEKFDFLTLVSESEYLNSEKILVDLCSYGSDKILYYLVQKYQKLSQETRQKCANNSLNLDTLKVVHENLDILPDQEGIENLCKAGRLDMIDYVNGHEPDRLKDKIFVKIAETE